MNNLKESAEIASKQSTNRVIISVPVNFDGVQKLAIKEAAKIANLDVIEIISEPIAASIFYAHQEKYKEEERNVLVYSYGKSQISATIVQIRGNEFSVVESYTNKHGDNEIDKFLLDFKIREVKRRFGVDISRPTNEKDEDKYFKQREILLRECERANNYPHGPLSIYDIHVFNLVDGKNYDTKIFKSGIIDAVDSHIDEFLDPIEKVMSQAIITKENMDLIIVGECRCHDFLIEQIEQEIGKKRLFPLYPPELATYGDALYGAIVSGKTCGDYSSIKINETHENCSILESDFRPHTTEEIVKMQNFLVDSVKIDINYLKMAKTVLKEIAIQFERKDVQTVIDDIKKADLSCFNYFNKMSREQYEATIAKAENEIKRIIPDYARSKMIQKTIDCQEYYY